METRKRSQMRRRVQLSLKAWACGGPSPLKAAWTSGPSLEVTWAGPPEGLGGGAAENAREIMVEVMGMNREPA